MLIEMCLLALVWHFCGWVMAVVLMVIYIYSLLERM